MLSSDYLPTQIEQRGQYSKSLEGRTLSVKEEDSPTYITPSAAQFDLIYDDLLNALMTGDRLLSPPAKRDTLDVPRSAITRKSNISIPDSLKPGRSPTNSQWSPNAFSNTYAQPSTRSKPLPIPGRRLSQRRKQHMEDYRDYLKDDYISAAKREHPKSDKLRYLQLLTEEAESRLMKRATHTEMEADERHVQSQATATSTPIVRVIDQDSQRKLSTSTVSTSVSTLATPQTPPNTVMQLPQQHETRPDGMRKSVRTRIAKGLRINPSITR
ncbi:hypothetical protein E3Q16_01711 [Wallemia mellicola]|nr:hypothetical protein E3Q16_01711 [Wallemia mellicola]